jgi:rhodanese-related sulfurtransferase
MRDDTSGARASLARDSLAIILIGVVLGAAFNAFGLTRQPPRGLPWIGAERTFGSLDTLAPLADAPGPAVGDLPAIPDVSRPLTVKLPTVLKFVAARAALVVDARDHDAFVRGHIPGAVSIPYDEAAGDPTRLGALDPGERPIIVYCSGGHCEASRMLAEILVQDLKRHRVLVYEGGFPEWEAAGNPVSRGDR